MGEVMAQLRRLWWVGKININEQYICIGRSDVRIYWPQGNENNTAYWKIIQTAK